jgi:hypothetical protein
MKKKILSAGVMILIIPFILSADDGKLSSKVIDELGQSFDKQITELNKNIQTVMVNANLMSVTGIKTLPYQTDIGYGPDESNPKYLQITKHIYIKKGLFSNTLIGLEEKVLRIYCDGKTISQIDTIIRTKNFLSQEEEIVSVSDPSPSTDNTDDMVLSHTFNKRKLVDQKKLGEVVNSIDAPMRNMIKSEFVIPSLSILHKNLLFITESNIKGAKEIDQNMAEFLKKSTLY